ncbi:MAG: FeoA domain-containing protein [Erysipelotrichales bacterium]|nr:FeoA domain-containing protein [Erysipelotrichales bacterium]
MKLSDAVCGVTYKVVSIEGTKEVQKKLYDFGFYDGTSIKVEKLSPYGNPIIIKINTYRVIISLYLSSLIEVEVIHK